MLTEFSSLAPKVITFYLRHNRWRIFRQSEIAVSMLKNVTSSSRCGARDHGDMHGTVSSIRVVCNCFLEPSSTIRLDHDSRIVQVQFWCEVSIHTDHVPGRMEGRGTPGPPVGIFCGGHEALTVRIFKGQARFKGPSIKAASQMIQC